MSRSFNILRLIPSEKTCRVQAQQQSIYPEKAKRGVKPTSWNEIICVQGSLFTTQFHYWRFITQRGFEIDLAWQSSFAGNIHLGFVKIYKNFLRPQDDRQWHFL